MNQTLLLILLAAGSAGAAPVLSSEPPRWPQFRGPNSSGVAETDKPPVEFGPGTNLLWKAEVPAGLSSPCVWGDRIFLTAVEDGKLRHARGESPRRQDALAPGHHRRQAARDCTKRTIPPPPRPPPTARACAFITPGWGLVAYDFDGRELWRKPHARPARAQWQRHFARDARWTAGAQLRRRGGQVVPRRVRPGHGQGTLAHLARASS